MPTARRCNAAWPADRIPGDRRVDVDRERRRLRRQHGRVRHERQPAACRDRQPDGGHPRPGARPGRRGHAAGRHRRPGDVTAHSRVRGPGRCDHGPRAGQRQRRRVPHRRGLRRERPARARGRGGEAAVTRAGDRADAAAGDRQREGRQRRVPRGGLVMDHQDGGEPAGCRRRGGHHEVNPGQHVPVRCRRAGDHCSGQPARPRQGQLRPAGGDLRQWPGAAGGEAHRVAGKGRGRQRPVPGLAQGGAHRHPGAGLAYPDRQDVLPDGKLAAGQDAQLVRGRRLRRDDRRLAGRLRQPRRRRYLRPVIAGRLRRLQRLQRGAAPGLPAAGLAGRAVTALADAAGRISPAPAAPADTTMSTRLISTETLMVPVHPHRQRQQAFEARIRFPPESVNISFMSP